MSDERFSLCPTCGTTRIHDRYNQTIMPCDHEARMLIERARMAGRQHLRWIDPEFWRAVYAGDDALKRLRTQWRTRASLKGSRV